MSVGNEPHPAPVPTGQIGGLKMGLDVSLHVRGNWAPEQKAEAERLFSNQLSGFLMDGALMPDVLDDGTPIIEAPTMVRFYGVGYERGDWPLIYTAIRIMRSTFPSCTVHYGSDGLLPEEVAPTTDDDLERIWQHYLGPHGDDYHARYAT